MNLIQFYILSGIYNNINSLNNIPIINVIHNTSLNFKIAIIVIYYVFNKFIIFSYFKMKNVGITIAAISINHNKLYFDNL